MLVLKIIVVLCTIVLTSIVLMIIRDRSINSIQKFIILILFILLCCIGIIVETHYEKLGYSRHEFGEMIAGYLFIIGLTIVLVAMFVIKVKNYINNKKNN